MRDAGHRTPDAGHRTTDIGHRTAKKAKIIYPPPRGVDIIQKAYVHYIQDRSTGGLVVDLLGSHHRTQMKKLRVCPSNIFKIVLGTGAVGLPVACCQDLVQRNATLKGFGNCESSNIMSLNLVQS